MPKFPRKVPGPAWEYKKYPKKARNQSLGAKEEFKSAQHESQQSGEDPEPVTSTSAAEEFLGFPESTKSEVALQEVDVYLFQLKSHGMLLPICRDTYAMQDTKNNKLQLHAFCLLQGRVIMVSDKPTYLWACSCDTLRQEFVLTLPNDVVNLDQDKYSDCIHIQAVQILTRETCADVINKCGKGGPYDHDYTKSANEYREPVFQHVPHHFATAAVFQSDIGLGIVSVTYPLPSQIATLRCHTCRRKYSCGHVNLVKDSIDTSPVLEELHMYLHLEADVPSYTQYISVAQNKGKYPFFKDDNFSTDLSSSCDCGYQWDVSEVGTEIPVFSLDNWNYEKVFTANCAGCSAEKIGLKTGTPVLFMTKYGVHFSVLWDYVKNFVTAGISMFEYFKMWHWDLFAVYGDSEVRSQIKYGRFRLAILSFVHGLDIDVQGGFLCPHCLEKPDKVVFDGMTLAFQKRLQLTERPQENSSKQFDGSQHNARVFLKNKEARNLLLKFVEVGLDEEELAHLLEISQLYQPTLVDLLRHCLENHLKKPPVVLRALLKDLSKNVPVAAILHPSHENLLLALCDGRQLTVEQLATLHSQCPFIAETLVEGRIAEPCFANILRDMIRISKEPFRVGEPDHPQAQEDDTMAFYPNLPKLCERGRYVLDAKPSLKEPECEKRKPSHPSLLPGLFSLLCPHGICYGFDIMETAESPNCAFTCLRTRFPKGPGLVIYDNSCHLHSYCLNRCSTFFEDTKFVVDRLHWSNHTGCSRGYNIAAYSCYDNVNSQVAEQRHSQLTKLKTMLSYMDSRNFIRFLSTFTWFHNCLKIVKLSPNNVSQYKNNFKILNSVFQRL